MLDIAFKEKWVSALRSGEYTQCRRVLKNEDGAYCCLGVAADILRPDGWFENTSPQWEGSFLNPAFVGEGSMNDTLADLGLSVQIRQDLVWMNDNEFASFDDIADHVEQLA